MENSGNPYRPAPGSQPPALVGREPELFAASNATSLTQGGGAAQPILFTGLRGMGKTAVLRRSLAEAEKKGGIILSAEAGDHYALLYAFHRSLDRAKHELRNTSTKLREAFDKAMQALPQPSYQLPHDMGSVSLKKSSAPPHIESLVRMLDDLNDAAWKHHRFLVVAIDEIQEATIAQLLPIVTFVHRTAGTNTPVLFLGAGLPNVPDHLHTVRTYTERWKYFMLGLLSREETIEAIALPAKERNVTFDPPALNRLVEETAGYPFFIQDYAAAVWTYRKGDRITLKNVDDVIPKVRKDLELGYYDPRFRKLTPREIRYTLAMANLGEGEHTVREVAERLGAETTQVNSMRNQLERKDVIFSPAKGLVQFRMPLTERYIATHRDELERRSKE